LGRFPAFDYVDPDVKIRTLIDDVKKDVVVGIIVDSKAQALALKNGLYVVKIREEEEKLDVETPDSCRTSDPAVPEIKFSSANLGIFTPHILYYEGNVSRNAARALFPWAKVINLTRRLV
jgi:hypothetical protein